MTVFGAVIADMDGVIQQEGVATFDDTVRALIRWRRGGLRLGIVTASRNWRAAVESAALPVELDVVVDGVVGSELGLADKAALMREAASRLGVAPARTVLLEDAMAGVQAARQLGFGLVVGVAHASHADALHEAGAQRVVSDVRALRFRRELPRLLERLDELGGWLATRQTAILLDYDGTLTPIVNDPEAAVLSDDMRDALRVLSQRHPVAVVSGRDRADVARRVAIEGLIYAGSHGFDIAGPSIRKTLPGAERLLPALDKAEAQLRAKLDGIDGVVIERKRFSIATHYRMVAQSRRAGVIETVEDINIEGLRRKSGKMVIELQPDLPWDKGRATSWLRRALDSDAGQLSVVYVGDDETDEDAFASLDADGIGIYVGEAIADSRADYCVADPGEVLRLLRWLAARS